MRTRTGPATIKSLKMRGRGGGGGWGVLYIAPPSMMVPNTMISVLDSIPGCSTYALPGIFLTFQQFLTVYGWRFPLTVPGRCCRRLLGAALAPRSIILCTVISLLGLIPGLQRFFFASDDCYGGP